MYTPAVPAVTEAAAQGILLAWAYGESVMDVRSLLDGKRPQLQKMIRTGSYRCPVL